jgi:hypothetical protein
MTAIFELAFLLFLSILEHSNVDSRCCPYLFFFFFISGCWFFCFVFKFSNVREAVCEREWGQRHSCHIIASSISVTSEAKVSFLLQILLLLLLLLLFARLVVVFSCCCCCCLSGDRFRLLLNRLRVSTRYLENPTSHFTRDPFVSLLLSKVPKRSGPSRSIHSRHFVTRLRRSIGKLEWKFRRLSQV